MIFIGSLVVVKDCRKALKFYQDINIYEILTESSLIRWG